MNYRRKNPRKTWLSGIAALALVAGTAVAAAQQSSQDHASQSKQPHAMQQTNQMQPTNQKAAAGKTSQQPTPGKMNQQSASDKTNQRPQERNRSAANQGQSGRTAQERNRMTRHDTAQGGMPRHNATAQGQERMKHAQRERTGLEGLQGNASGMKAPLTDAQRTQIRNTVIDARGAPKVGQVNFDVTVGTAIPRGRVHVVPVPETLVRIEPAWRGMLYFVYSDEVVIVNPRDMKIVAVVPA